MLNHRYHKIFGCQPKSLLHIGANQGQEVDLYAQLGINAVHIEAIPEIFNKLSDKCSQYKNQKAILGCCSNKKGQKVIFNIASNGGQSSSMLEFGYHSEEHPSIKYIQKIELTTTTLDQLIYDNLPNLSFDFLVFDIQGAELLALQGAHKLLSQPSMRALGIEVAHEELYQNGADFKQMLAFLEEYDFFLKDLNFNHSGWGNAIFVKKWWGESSPLIQGMLCNYEKIENIAINNVFLSSSHDDNLSKEKLMDSLLSNKFTLAFKTKKQLNPYVIVEFDEVVPYDAAVAIYNSRGHLAQTLSSIKVEYSSDGVQWNLMESLLYQAEFLKSIAPLLCCSFNRFKFIRISLQKEAPLQINQLSLLRKKHPTNIKQAYNQIVKYLNKTYPFKVDGNNVAFFKYFKNSQYTSQCGQDFIVEHLLKHKQKGFFIEMGALDGKMISNTYLLEKKYHWNGLCIEPQKIQFETLKKNRNCLCDNSCVDGDRGVVEFVTFQNGVRKAWYSGIVGEDLENRKGGEKFDRFEYKISQQQTVLLEDVLLKYKVPNIIDYFSFDVEGAEYRILKKFPFNKYKFLYLNIEKPSEELIALLQENNYIYLGRHHFDGHFCHQELLEAHS